MAIVNKPCSFDTGIVLKPLSADPVNPVEGQQQISDGTHRTAGLWVYDGSAWNISTLNFEDAALTGNPTAPTQLITDDSTRIATTEFVKLISLGWGQSYNDVTGSRANNVTYTNTTGKPLIVVVSFIAASANAFGELVCDEERVDGAYSRSASPYANDALVGIIPAGSTYRAVQSVYSSLTKWVELTI